MPKPTPEVRADREYGNKVEDAIIEAIVYRMADAVNAATRTGSKYGRMILPPEMAERKRMLMEQQGGQ